MNDSSVALQSCKALQIAGSARTTLRRASICEMRVAAGFALSVSRASDAASCTTFLWVNQRDWHGDTLRRRACRGHSSRRLAGSPAPVSKSCTYANGAKEQTLIAAYLSSFCTSSVRRSEQRVQPACAGIHLRPRRALHLGMSALGRCQPMDGPRARGNIPVTGARTLTRSSLAPIGVVVWFSSLEQSVHMRKEECWNSHPYKECVLFFQVMLAASSRLRAVSVSMSIVPWHVRVSGLAIYESRSVPSGETK